MVLLTGRVNSQMAFLGEYLLASVFLITVVLVKTEHCGISFYNTHREPRRDFGQDSSISNSHEGSSSMEDRLSSLRTLSSQLQNLLGLYDNGSRNRRKLGRDAGNQFSNTFDGGIYDENINYENEQRTNYTQRIKGRMRTNNRMMVFEDKWSGRIIGGKESKQGAWPWQVSVQLIHPRWGRVGHWCGGVLIAPRWVVTAAHCIKNRVFNLPFPPLWSIHLSAFAEPATSEDGSKNSNVNVMKDYGESHSEELLNSTIHTQKVPRDENGHKETTMKHVFAQEIPFSNYSAEKIRSSKSIVPVSTKGTSLGSKAQIKKIFNSGPESSYSSEINYLSENNDGPFDNDNKNEPVNENIESEATESMLPPRIQEMTIGIEKIFLHERFRNFNHDIGKGKAFTFTNSAALWQVVLGEHDRSLAEGSEQLFGVDTIYTHDLFDNYQNDIALLHLDADVSYTTHIQPICLPDSTSLREETFLGIKCVSVGWGMRLYGARLEDKLKEVWLPVVANRHCAKMYGMIHNVPVRRYHMCAGPINDGGRGTCIGDSGGPLQCNMKDGRWYLAGVTSFGSGCAKPGFPDVFTRITYYLPWIKQKMRAF
ncbi:Serine proteases trypsin domain [Trinorchestia longiramus]|nr:Serine proteases trypsin domain [Trinorchestia longiramus]